MPTGGSPPGQLCCSLPADATGGPRHNDSQPLSRPADQIQARQPTHPQLLQQAVHMRAMGTALGCWPNTMACPCNRCKQQMGCFPVHAPLSKYCAGPRRGKALPAGSIPRPPRPPPGPSGESPSRQQQSARPGRTVRCAASTRWNASSPTNVRRTRGRGASYISAGGTRERRLRAAAGGFGTGGWWQSGAVPCAFLTSGCPWAP